MNKLNDIGNLNPRSGGQNWILTVLVVVAVLLGLWIMSPVVVITAPFLSNHAMRTPAKAQAAPALLRTQPETRN